MTRALRDYQQAAIDAVRTAVAEGERRIVLAMPTGAGKTVIAGGIVDRALHKGKKVLFTVPAISLVDQTVQSFWDEGFRDIGVIQANHAMTDWSKPVQVASVQTLIKRKAMPEADLMLVDECHRMFDWYGRTFTLDDWRAKPIIGLSATPWTRGLGKLYNRLIVATTTAQLIELEYLSPFRVFAPSHPDLSKVRTVAGDYHEGDLGGVMNDHPLVADVVDTWMRRGENRSTFCFAVNCAHAQHLQLKFSEAGIATGYIDADTPLEEREKVKDQFHDGRIRVVCNVGCLTTGIDWDVRCIILARPTKSEMLFVQMIGRGLRTAEDKDNCLILDHSDTTLRLGFVTDIHHETLDDGRERAKANGVSRIRLPKECPQCAYLKPPRMPKCPACGFETARICEVESTDGELVEVNGRRKPSRILDDPAKEFDPPSFYAQLKAYGEQHGYAPGWSAHKFRERFDSWPEREWKYIPSIEPTPRVANWIKSRQIAWAKAKARHDHADAAQ